MTSSKVCYVAVHGGAGQHSRVSEAEVKGAMKRACTEALRMTSEVPSTTALSIIELAITILENDDCLNAGYGSNLTFDGTVECDAAIMDGPTGDFGSVGALSGVRNPIKVASAVLAHGRVPDVGLGRIRPLTLVSTGAHAFAHKNGIETIDPTNMIAPRAKQDWQRWVKRHDEIVAASIAGDRLEAVSVPPQDAMQDTVGAVAWDSEGNLAAGVSSGGLLLKYSGRIGEAATFGAGCWAEQSQDGQAGIACSISGAGEHIMRIGLARTIADALRPVSDRQGQDGREEDIHESLTRTLSTHFYDPIVKRGDTHPNVGVLLMTKEVQEAGNVIPRLWCAFITESIAVAYASSEKPIPKAKILRRPQASQPVLATNTSPVYITALPLRG